MGGLFLARGMLGLLSNGEIKMIFRAVFFGEGREEKKGRDMRVLCILKGILNEDSFFLFFSLPFFF